MKIIITQIEAEFDSESVYRNRPEIEFWRLHYIIETSYSSEVKEECFIWNEKTLDLNGAVKQIADKHV